MHIDIFPPVLVKEIRQGLKTKAFAFTLIGQQALMVITILFYLLGVRAGNDIEFANGLFWFCLCVPLLAVMPARGFQGIHEERTSQTLELLFLTRLSARQIVVGKWVALFAQALLIVVATLPYMVIRYFLGGIDISSDLAITGWLTLACAALTALAIGLSSVENKAIRVLIMIAAVLSIFPFLSFGMMTVMGGSIFGGVSSGGGPKAATVLGIIGLCLLGGAYALYFGASLIAPQAENHALPKRLIGLLGIAAVTAMAVASGQDEFMAFLFPLVILVGADALTEEPPRVRSVYARRDGGRWPLPPLLRPFLPGWPSGIVYLFVISLTSWALLQALFQDIDNPWALMLAVVTGLLYPLPLILLLGSRIKRIGPAYILLQVIQCILSALLMTAVGTNALEDVTIAGLPPVATFILAATEENNWEHAVAVLAVLMCACLVVLLVKAISVWETRRRSDLCPENEVSPAVTSSDDEIIGSDFTRF